MRILLINNRTKRIKQIQEMLSEHDIKTINVWSLNRDDYKDGNFDLVILSGGSFARAFTRSGSYNVEIDLIRNFNKPIFGICMGMQLIAHAFNDHPFSELRPKRRGIIKLNYKGEIINVFENHKWAIEKISNPLVELAKSEDGIEIIKHKEKPIMGVQFHPEVDSEYGIKSRWIFDEFINDI